MTIKPKRAIDVAVVGVGSMGKNHARVLAGLKNANLVAVVDIDFAAARAVAELYGCAAYGDVGDLPGKIQAATVATPAISHASVGTFLLNNGIHCMVEKPLAPSEAECLQLIEAARNRGLVLMVGHIERFNPAVARLVEILPKEGRVFSVDARRLSWVPARANDVDVIIDLMVHDLDIIHSVIDCDVRSCHAAGIDTRGNGIDHVTSVLTFSNGATALLTASKVTHTKIRDMQVITDRGMFQLDFIRQELVVYRQGLQVVHGDEAITPYYSIEATMERIVVRNAEPLAQELEHFISVVEKGGQPRIAGEDALRCLKTAWRLQNEIGRSSSFGGN
jgi:predicted dehydrogenase